MAGMVVKNNLSANRTLNILNGNTSALQKSLTKVSSGMKINSAQDDASGYAISERMRVRIRSLDQANQNSQNDASLMKTAEGAVANTVEILRALKEKAINAANDTNTDEDRQTIQKEINQFIDQIDDNALVQFNGKYLLDGSKNNVTNPGGTKTILLNQSLAKDTTLTTALTDLNNRANDSLGIQSSDKWQVSWVQNGEIHSTSGNVGTMDLKTLLGKATGTDAVATDDTGLISNAAKLATDDTSSAPKAMEDFTPPYEEVASINLGSSASAGAVDAAGRYVNSGDMDAAATTWETTFSGLGFFKTAGESSTALSKAEIFDAISTGGTVELSGYYVNAETNANSDANPQEVTISISFATTNGPSNGNGELTYTISVDTTGDPTSQVTGDVKLYAKSELTALDAPDKFGRAVYTPDETAGVAVAAASAGVENQLAGLTISILDQDGNVKKAANAALDQFKQYQRAENQTGDMSLNFHIGSEANVSFKVGMGDMRAQALGLKGSDGKKIDVYTKDHANAAINVIENALAKALDQQTTIGAIEARLEYTSTNLTTSSENVQAAESTIRDADMAKEMTNYTKSNVLLQAAQAMLAQANQNSSAVLSLLQ